jgi:hypothetical protein
VIELADVLKIVKAFNHEGVEYKVFGGIAVNLHGIIRATEDVDFFVDPNPGNVARIKRAFRSIWDDPNLDEIDDDDMIGEYPSFNYNPPNELYGIDVVSRLGEAFAYADLPFQTIDIDGVDVRVVTAHALYVMKKDTVRYHDQIDTVMLSERFGFKE